MSTINREAAIAYLISGMTREIDGDKWIRVSEVRESIKTMPSAQPERKKEKWIPVSEMLPKEEVQVLVTDDAGGLATIDVDCGYFDEEYGRFEWFHSQNVTAWMPLPEPWRGEKG